MVQPGVSRGFGDEILGQNALQHPLLVKLEHHAVVILE